MGGPGMGEAGCLPPILPRTKMIHARESVGDFFATRFLITQLFRVTLKDVQKTIFFFYNLRSAGFIHLLLPDLQKRKFSKSKAINTKLVVLRASSSAQ